MAMTDSAKISNVYKKLLGVAETNTSKLFFEEPYQSSIIVLPSMIWRDAGSIPFPAPNIIPYSQVDPDSGDTLVFGTDGNVTAYYLWVPLRAVPGSPNAFYHPALHNAIPFNFDTNGTYAYRLRNSNNFDIAFGVQDWLVDPVAGTLTFYGNNLSAIGVSASTPPKITFYKYIGRSGLGDSGTGDGITLPIPDSEILLSKNSNPLRQARLTIDGTANATLTYRLPALSGSSTVLVTQDDINAVLDAIGVVDGGVN